MRLKSFYAKTVTEAMKMVRETLGDDAIIVATQEENGGRSVRLTAAIDRADDGPAFEIQSTRKIIRKANTNLPIDYLQYDIEEDAEDEVNEILTDTLLRHGVPADISDIILSNASMIGMNEPISAMRDALDHSFTFAPLPLKSKKALMMIGAPGVGKTLATAKLAARATLSGLKTAVITTDTIRAGGVEQLEAFTKLLQIPLQKARTSLELRSKLETLQNIDLILIDTGGCNPFDIDDMRAQAALLDSGNIDPILVMGAGGDAEECAEMARCFAVLGVQRLLPTRLDITRRMGGLLAATGRSGIAFSDASNTPKVADGIVSLSAQSLANMLLPASIRHKTARKETARTSNIMTKNTRRTG
jgi:flagellar biosynthesis protein FlhF